MYEQQPSESTNVFRDVFKYNKRRQPKPDLSNVVDFHDESNTGACLFEFEVNMLT